MSVRRNSPPSIGDPVLPHEDRNEFGVVNRSYFYDFSPATAHEGYLVNEMAGARWRMARAMAAKGDPTLNWNATAQRGSAPITNASANCARLRNFA